MGGPLDFEIICHKMFDCTLQKNWSGFILVNIFTKLWYDDAALIFANLDETGMTLVMKPLTCTSVVESNSLQWLPSTRNPSNVRNHNPE